MNETTFNWDDLRLFLAVARHGGLAAAQSETGKSAPTLARRMLALERIINQDLFERLPRGYVLTPRGAELLERVEQLESDIQPILTPASSNTQQRVKVSAGTWTTFFVLSKLVSLAKDPSIVIQFISADRILDIPHREAVIGIRNKRPDQVSLAGKQLKSVQFAVYADNSSAKRWVLVQNNTPSADWVKRNHPDAPAIEVTNPRNALDIALTGGVNVVLPTFVGDAQEGLVRISDHISALEHKQWLVCHHDDRNLPEVRYVLDLLNQVFSNS